VFLHVYTGTSTARRELLPCAPSAALSQLWALGRARARIWAPTQAQHVLTVTLELAGHREYGGCYSASKWGDLCLRQPSPTPWLCRSEAACGQGARQTPWLPTLGRC
jgi:hypothetical protein